MRVGDLIRWAGKQTALNIDTDLGMVVRTENVDGEQPIAEIHWFTDGEQYTYYADDTDLEVLDGSDR